MGRLAARGHLSLPLLSMPSPAPPQDRSVNGNRMNCGRSVRIHTLWDFHYSPVQELTCLDSPENRPDPFCIWFRLPRIRTITFSRRRAFQPQVSHPSFFRPETRLYRPWPEAAAPFGDLLSQPRPDDPREVRPIRSPPEKRSYPRRQRARSRRAPRDGTQRRHRRRTVAQERPRYHHHNLGSRR